MMDVLSAAFGVARDVPLVLVNEPIFVAPGANRLVRYNGFYPRWVYDEYRQFMLEWTDSTARHWRDYWDALPPQDFNDAFFHRRASGEERFARLLAPEIRRLGCH
jgi:hypothetical protein